MFPLTLKRTVLMGLVLASSIAAVMAIQRSAESKVEGLLRGNMVANGLLQRIQLGGERLRRFEKEMFIYVDVPDKREGYVKEFDGAYQQLLRDLDEALAPSNPAFTDPERAEMLKWKAAANTYSTAFDQLTAAARQNDRGEKSAAAAAGVAGGPRSTKDFNVAITNGKDAFRLLLKGSEDLRLQKKADPIVIAAEVSSDLRRTITLGAALALLAGVLLTGLWLTGQRRAAVGLPRPLAAPGSAAKPEFARTTNSN